MAHHGSEPLEEHDRLRRQVREFAVDAALGATDKFPRGKVNEQDEGGIMMAVAHDHGTKTVVINFGKPTAWLALEYENAIELSNMIRDSAFALRGITAC